MNIFDLLIDKCDLEDEINEYWTCPRCRSYVKSTSKVCDACHDLNDLHLLELNKTRRQEKNGTLSLAHLFFGLSVFVATVSLVSLVI